MLFGRKKKYTTIEELVRGCQRSEPAAQRILYEQYKKKMMHVCQRYARTLMESEDIF